MLDLFLFVARMLYVVLLGKNCMFFFFRIYHWFEKDHHQDNDKPQFQYPYFFDDYVILKCIFFKEKEPNDNDYITKVSNMYIVNKCTN